MKTIKEAQPKKFTEAQREALETFDEDLLVTAGAGSGKTTVLVERFLHAALKKDVDPERILTITFTDKAANEVKSRIMKRLGELGRDRDRRDLESSYISTIHTFAARLLREHPFEAGVDPDFRVIC